jgi:predicted transcriptional regulator
MSEERPPTTARPARLLGELEAAIMDLIWQRGEMTVREVWETLQPTRPLAYTTIMTVMGRLVPKGVLIARKQGRTYYYRATAAPDEFVAQRAHAAVQDLLANFGDVGIAQFLRELDGVDPQRLAALRDAAESRASDGEEETDAR